MMKLMEEFAQFVPLFVSDQQTFEAGMRSGCAEHLALLIEENMDRVRSDNPMSHDRAQPEDVLNRMHGAPGPWADVGIAMVYSVGNPIERRPME